MPNLSDFCFMFASECNEMGVLIQSRHIRSAFSRPERLHSVLSRSQGEKFTPCFLHSHGTRIYAPQNGNKSLLGPGHLETPSMMSLFVSPLLVSRHTYALMIWEKEWKRMPADFYLYIKEKKNHLKISPCVCGVGSLVAWTSCSVTATGWFAPLTFVIQKKTQVQKPCQAEELTAQPLPSWEDIHLAQKISLLLMQTDDRLPAEQRVRDSGWKRSISNLLLSIC